MDLDIYSTQEAADFLGLSLSAVKKHVHQGHLVPRLIGRTYIFTRAQLEEFQRNRRPPGRPRKETN